LSFQAIHPWRVPRFFFVDLSTETMDLGAAQACVQSRDNRAQN
jgi:hypothetical protein